ncbi:hypothetical protein D3C81_2036520 [compost metagenome]
MLPAETRDSQVLKALARQGEIWVSCEPARKHGLLSLMAATLCLLTSREAYVGNGLGHRKTPVF